MKRYILDIPVYRIGRDAIDQQFANAIDQRCNELDPSEYQTQQEFESHQARIRDQLAESLHLPWQFNQVVGWLRLYAAPSRIGAEHWFVTAKRLSANLRKKRFLLSGGSDALQASYLNQNSSEIFFDLIDRLQRYPLENSGKSLVLDLSTLQEIGPFVDWRALIDKQS